MESLLSGQVVLSFHFWRKRFCQTTKMLRLCNSSNPTSLRICLATQTTVTKGCQAGVPCLKFIKMKYNLLSLAPFTITYKYSNFQTLRFLST